MSAFRHTRPMVGHMSDRGFWHSGARSVCSKCDDKSHSAHPGKTVCQFCRLDLGDVIEKRVHATVTHGRGEQPTRFSACRSGDCNERVFVGSTCEACNTYQDPNNQTIGETK